MAETNPIFRCTNLIRTSVGPTSVWEKCNSEYFSRLERWSDDGRYITPCMFEMKPVIQCADCGQKYEAVLVGTDWTWRDI